MPRIFLYLCFPLFLVMGCGLFKPALDSASSPSPAEFLPFPTLLAQPQGDTASQPLQIQELDVSIQCNGLWATTTLEIAFYNPHNQVLSGTFFLPLAANQQVKSFALEIENEWRNAVVVPKEKGTEVFEAVVREQVDPGLLEYVRGKGYKASVYPIPAQGIRRIRVSFDGLLTLTEQQSRYQLPLQLRDTLSRFALNIEADDALAQLVEAPIAGFRLNQQGNSWKGEEVTYDVQPNGAVNIAFPRKTEPEIWVETDQKGDTWFALYEHPGWTKRIQPEATSIGILWDVSHSAGARDIEKELALLQAYLNEVPTARIGLIPFHQEVMPMEEFQVEKGNTESLFTRIRNLPNDGATRLQALDLTHYAFDSYWLCSDGWATLGGEGLKPNDRPIMCISSSPTLNVPYLSYLTASTGGKFLPLSGISPREALASLLTESHQVQEVQVVRGQVEDVSISPSMGRQGLMLITGRMRSKEVTLRLTYKGEKGQPYTSTTTFYRPDVASFAPVVPRIWAFEKGREWMGRINPPKDSLINLAIDYQLVTPYSSLLILDEVEDYVRFEIDPPASLRAEYEELKAKEEKSSMFALFSHLDEVAEAFAEREAWWNTTFEVPPYPYETEEIRKGVEAVEEDAAFGEAPPSASGDEDADGLGDLFAEEEASFEGEAEPDRAETESTEEKAEESEGGKTTIRITTWMPDMPYRNELLRATPETFEAVYLRFRPQYQEIPGFFADAAQIAQNKGLHSLAYRILSNLLEINPEATPLLRAFAYQAQRWDSLGVAEEIFETVLEARPFEPQAHRDLGLVQIKQGKAQQGLERLYEVVRRKWDARFPEIEVVTVHEMNSIIGSLTQPVDLGFMDDRLIIPMPTDLRVVLTWDANDVDLDLWVIDPRGEKCYYQHPRTEIGGLISADFTWGYGPEEFLLKDAMPGVYTIEANYYANKQQRLAGPATLQVRMIQDYGRPSQREQVQVVRLGTENEVVKIGTFTVEE